MYKIFFEIGFLSFVLSLTALPQTLTVGSGYFSVHGNSCVTLSGTSLINHGSFSGLDSSTLIISGSLSDQEIGGSAGVVASNLKINSACNLNTGLNLLNDITMASGIFTLNAVLTLGGQITGEREESRITSSETGELVKTVTLVSNQPINPGNIGITITPVGDYSNVEFRRGNLSLTNGALQSINRYFSFPELGESTAIQFSYFDAELNGLTEANLTLTGEYQNSWIPMQFVASNPEGNSFTGNIDRPVTRVSLFEGSLNTIINIPTGFSPNFDGVNDYFIIPGVENYYNNRLIIFNQWGDVLYESSPYRNDWAGVSESAVLKTKDQILLDGTYFFIFYPDKNDKVNFKSGFVEIKTGDNN